MHVVLRERGWTRAVRVLLEPFTLVAATTRLGVIAEPFRSRFPLQERLDYYGEEELSEVVLRGAKRLGITVSEAAAREAARRSKGTVRVAIRILARARDVAQLSAPAPSDLARVVQVMAPDIGLAHVVQASERLGIDEHGLGRVEQAVVRFILDRGARAPGWTTLPRGARSSGAARCRSRAKRSPRPGRLEETSG